MAVSATSTTSAASSITAALGAGSGIDITSLVSQLVQAQFAAQTKKLTGQADQLTAQVSGVAKLKSAITGFDSALKSLVTGGTLSTQPASSDEKVARASLLPGASVSPSTAGSLQVRQLAQAQAATTRAPVAATAAFSAGTLTFQLGTETTANGATSFAQASSFDVTIGSGDATLAGIAARINAANKGVTATVVSDQGGQRLQLKGPSGAAGAFRVTGADNAGADGAPPSGVSLSTLDVSRDAESPGAIGASAQDAVLVLDGAEFRRSTNSVSDLVQGVRLDLTGTGTMALTTSSPASGIAQAVSDFADTYNEVLGVVKEESDPVAGVLKGEASVSALAQGLRRLTTQALGTSTAPGAPHTLADLGVATDEHSGALKVDANRLGKVLAAYPAEVEAMFAGGAGLPAALSKLATAASSSVYGLTAATARYTDLQKTNAAAQADLSTQSDTAKTRMTAQYAAMDARVAAYKSTQTFLENQIKAWNKSDD